MSRGESNRTTLRSRAVAVGFGAIAAMVAIVACSGNSVERRDSATGQPPHSGPVQTIDSGPRAAAGAGDTVLVYKSPTCGCCAKWVDVVRAAGFAVKTIDTDDLTAVKRANGVREDLSACHTALVGGYVVEGHVPPGDIRRLLRERPAVAGLAVPGMPMGSPGMEGPYKEAYEVSSFDRAGRVQLFARH